jgi:hypothetical protein
MRRRVCAVSATIILAAVVGAAAVASTAQPAESSGHVSWSSRRGDVDLTAAAWKRKNGERCVSDGVEVRDAAGADLFICLPKLGRDPHGVVVMQCAARLAVVAGLARSTARSARVRPNGESIVDADSVRAPVLDGATFFAHALAFRELPARIALRDTAGAIVGRVLIAPTHAAECDDGSTIYRYF